MKTTVPTVTTSEPPAPVVVEAGNRDVAEIELTGRRVDLHGAAIRTGGPAAARITHAHAALVRANIADRSVRLMAGTFLGAQLADIATTNIALQRAGLVENNPLFRTLFHVLPSYANLIKLVAAMGVIVFALSMLAPPRARAALIVAATLSLVAPVLNSLRLLGIW